MYVYISSVRSAQLLQTLTLLLHRQYSVIAPLKFENDLNVDAPEFQTNTEYYPYIPFPLAT